MINSSLFLVAFVDAILSGKNENRTAAQQLTYSSRMQTAITNTIQTKQILDHLIKHVMSASFNGEKIMYVKSLLTAYIGSKLCDMGMNDPILHY